MPGYSRVLLLGNLTRDPVLKQLPGNTQVAEFGMAANRKFRSAGGEERVDTVFVDCSAFGKLADTIAHYCHKGRPLFIEGRLRYDAWEDKQGGKHNKLSVVVEGIQFIGNREDANRATAQPRAEKRNAEAVSVKQDDVPF